MSCEGNPVNFQTSTYGRVGHFLMALVSFAGSFFFAALLMLGVFPLSAFITWVLIITGLFFFYVFIYCIGFACERSSRFVCTEEYLFYRGLVTSSTIPWTEITEIRIDFGHNPHSPNPFVFLVIGTSSRKFPYRMNMSGLQPNYLALFGLIARMVSEARIWIPGGYDFIDSSKSGRVRKVCLEHLVDHSITLSSTKSNLKNDA